VAVVTTCGSGAGSATTDVELESAAIAENEAVEDCALLGVADTGVGAGAAIGLRSVVASTTIKR